MPVYILTGDDYGVVERAKDIILSAITVLPELNVTFFDDGADIRAVEACCRSYPIMSDRRAVILRDYKQSLASMKNYLSDPLESTILIFMTQSLTQNFAGLTGKAEIVECSRLPDDVLLSYISKITKENDCLITRKAAQLLIDYTQGKLSAVENETKKLCGMRPLIEEIDVIENVNADVEYKIFELSDAITKKDGAKALAVLQGLLSDGYAPGALFGMLESHFRRLLYVSLNKEDENLAAKLGIKEGAVAFAKKTVVGFKPTTLKRIYDFIAEDEYRFKSGASADKDAVYFSVLKALNA